MRGRRTRAVVRMSALVALAPLIVSVLPPSSAQAASDTMSTLAGSLGQGPSTLVGQFPIGVAAGDSLVYISDIADNIVRSVTLGYQGLLEPGTEMVFAGNGAPGFGSPGFGGDGGPAEDAQFDDPTGLAVDSSGNVYIADTFNGRVRKVDTQGVITTVAGSGGGGPLGDGGPATSAPLTSPRAVAVDASGNLYIAEGGTRVRRVNTLGIITTYAGNGTQGYSGDGGPATAAQLSNPQGLAFDNAGRLLIADSSNNRIRRVATNGIISTVAGSSLDGFGGDGGPATSARLTYPVGAAADAAGAFFIADVGNKRVRKVDPQGKIHTFAGTGATGFSGDGGPATAATFTGLTDLAITPDGELLIVDANGYRVRMVLTGGTMATFAGNGTPQQGGDGRPAVWAQFDTLRGVVADDAGNTYVADAAANRVRRIDASGTISTVAGMGEAGYSGDGGEAGTARLSAPYGLALDRSGALFIADRGNGVIRRVSPTGVIQTVAGTGQIMAGPDGVPATSSPLSFPDAVAVDASGRLFIAESAAFRIRRVETNGIIHTIAGNGVEGFGGDGGPALQARFGEVEALAVDDAGSVYLADANNQRVRKIDPGGTITTVAGNGLPVFGGDGGPATSASLHIPSGIALGPTGDLFIADLQNQRIRKVDASGNISTVAGTGTAGFSGDGGPATVAQLYYPEAVSVSASGRVVIADLGNHRVRQIGEAETGRIPTRLEASPALAHVHPRTMVYLSHLEARLTAAETTAPIAGKFIDFFIGGKRVCRARTGSDGIARCSRLTFGVAALIHLGYEAVFAGDETYLPSSDHAPLATVGPASTSSAERIARLRRSVGGRETTAPSAPPGARENAQTWARAWGQG